MNAILQSVVEVLVQHRADINLIDDDGWNTLMRAAAEGHWDVAELLIRHNADMNVTTKDGSTALMLAADGGHLGAVSIRKTVLPGMAIPMLKIRRPSGRLIFNMEITIRR